MPRSSNGSQMRCWCFTINNPTAADDPREWEQQGAKFCVWQRERGENGTEHFQGYVQFKKVKRLTEVKKVNARAHWEPARGNPDENRAYCTKEETRQEGPWEYGECGGQGQRSDLAEVAPKVWDGTMTLGELRDYHPQMYCQYGNAIRRGITECLPDRHWACDGIVYWGPSGIGKSRLVEATYGGADVYWKKDSTKWWDGYLGQKTVIWDDFDPHTIPYKYLLRIVDRYPMAVEVKGGYVQLQAERVVFTSVDDPAAWYPEMNHDYQLNQLMRRLSEIHHVTVAPTQQSIADALIAAGRVDDAAALSTQSVGSLRFSTDTSASVSVLDDPDGSA